MNYKLKLKCVIAAYKTAIREQKLALEISAAGKERDFYLSKVNKSYALRAIDERLKKVLNLCFLSAVHLTRIHMTTH